MPGLVVGSPLSFIGEAWVGASDVGDVTIVVPDAATSTVSGQVPFLELRVFALVAAAAASIPTPAVEGESPQTPPYTNVTMAGVA